MGDFGVEKERAENDTNTIVNLKFSRSGLKILTMTFLLDFSQFPIFL